MHPLRFSMDECGHLTASVSDQRGRHLTVDMLCAVRVAKRSGHSVQNDSSRTRIDRGRRVVIEIDGMRVGQLPVRRFLVLSAKILLRRDNLHAVGHPHTEEQAVTSGAAGAAGYPVRHASPLQSQWGSAPRGR